MQCYQGNTRIQQSCHVYCKLLLMLTMSWTDRNFNSYWHVIFHQLRFLVIIFTYYNSSHNNKYIERWRKLWDWLRNDILENQAFSTVTHTHTHPFNGPLPGTTRMSWYQKGKTNLDFTEARVSQWHWHQLSHMQVCTLLQRNNHASTPPLSFLQARCPSCRQTNNVKALKENQVQYIHSVQ